MYGANPYLQGPHAIALDPIYPFIGAKWVTTPTAYGPLFTVLSYALAPLSIAASALAYKAIAAIASLALVGIVWNAARLRGLDPVRAAALVGLNPSDRALRGGRRPQRPADAHRADRRVLSAPGPPRAGGRRLDCRRGPRSS